MDAVQVDDRVDRIQRPGLPRLDLVDDRIGHGRDQAGRDLRAVHLLQVRLDLAHRHAAGVQRQDLVVEAGPAGLVLGNQLRLEAALAVAGHLDRQRAELALERLAAAAVAGVAGRVGHRRMPVVAEVLGHLGVQRLLHQQLGQLLEQAVLADQVLGLLVVRQQAGQQLVGHVMVALAHCVSRLGGSFLPVARLHKI